MRKDDHPEERLLPCRERAEKRLLSLLRYADSRGVGVKSAGSRAYLAVAFFMGFAAAIAQVVLVRELMTLCRGNELVIGIIFSSWFLGIFLGARINPPGSAASLERRVLASLALLPCSWRHPCTGPGRCSSSSRGTRLVLLLRRGDAAPAPLHPAGQLLHRFLFSSPGRARFRGDERARRGRGILRRVARLLRRRAPLFICPCRGREPACDCRGPARRRYSARGPVVPHPEAPAACARRARARSLFRTDRAGDTRRRMGPDPYRRHGPAPAHEIPDDPRPRPPATR